MSDTRASFVHLNVHTQYSLLEGAIRIPALMNRVQEMGMSAVAITDTNNLFGAVDFYTAAKKKGIQPIIGCELLSAAGSRHTAYAVSADPTKKNSSRFKPFYYPITVLCKNLQGYRNLCRMITQASLEAPEPKKGEAPGPRSLIDWDLLNRYGDDLIVFSGPLKGEIAYLILMGQEDEAKELVQKFHERFGKNFYLELVDSMLPEQEHVNETLYEWGKKWGIECVATTDCHYLDPKQGEAHEVLICIDHGKNLDFDRPKSLVPYEYYLKSPELMIERFARYPEAVQNTVKIAEQCDLEFKFEDDEGKPIYHLPNFRPAGKEDDPDFNLEEYFRESCNQGLRDRFTQPQFKEKVQRPDWNEQVPLYQKRLDYEIDMILKTGFSGYFLIVSDFIMWSKSNGIPVGPGRGSGAGSLVAYSLGITDLDPIEYNLLFERFINPERISMPDFDVDFCQDRRGEVIEYVGKKYGSENVCQIITFGKLQARAAIKDVGRVLGLSFAETDRITKLIPDELNITLKAALEKEPRLREVIEQEPKLAKLMEYALELEGLYRNAGIHAAGVIITEKPIVNYCPLYKTKDGDVTTQLDKDFSEKIGLVKFDFLGLKTLTVIDNAVKLVRSSAEPGTPEENFEIEQIPYTDEAVFELVGSGDTNGVFQVESSGMKDLCTRLKPNSIEDLTAINALYRPGPLGSGMVDDFIDRKHGRQKIEYELPILEPILKDTYGVILYQEQVMQIARELAGYSLGQADMLRRAMGKKKADEMDRHREIFKQGAKEKGIPEKSASSIFDLMAKFAEYGFNKSHSAAYAVLTYQTAYLKAHYPAEFMAALMTTEINSTEKITKYIGDARAHNIPILPPCVNRSLRQFSVEKMDGKKGIRFGLEAIKGVGGIAVDSVIEARELEASDDDSGLPTGPFKSVLEFCKRVPTRKVNKKVLEAMTRAGAFDDIAEANRPTLLASIEDLIKHASDEQEERALGQNSLFDAFDADEIQLVTPSDSIFKEQPDWTQAVKLQKEKETLGFYVSGHPMDGWQTICDDWLGWTIAKAKTFAEQQSQRAAAAPASDGGGYQRRPQRKEIRIAGLFTEMKEITTKKGKRMAFGQFEDLHDQIEVVFFPDAFMQLQPQIARAMAQTDAVVLGGELDVRDGEAKILAQSIEWASEAHDGRVQRVVLKLDPSQTSVDQLRELKRHLLDFRGKCPVQIRFQGKRFKTSMELPSSLQVAGTPKMVASVNRVFGKPVVDLK